MKLQAERFEGETSFQGTSSSVRSQNSSNRRSGSSNRRVEGYIDKTEQHMNTESKHNDKLEGTEQKRYNSSRSDSRGFQESELSKPSGQHIVEHGNEMDHEVFYANDISEQEPKKDIIKELEYLQKLGDYFSQKEEKEMSDKIKQRRSENETDKHGQTAKVETLDVHSDSEEIKIESDEDITEIEIQEESKNQTPSSSRPSNISIRSDANLAENYNVDMNISIPSSPPGGVSPPRLSDCENNIQLIEDTLQNHNTPNFLIQIPKTDKITPILVDVFT